MECNETNSTKKDPENAAAGARPLRHPWQWAAIAVVLVLGWQAANVHVNYAGNWTGLFRIGGQRPLPERMEQSVFRNPHPKGFDGQFYRLVAHDPFLRSGTAVYLDAPMVRSRRILVPLLAWMVALGRDEWVDGAYVAVVLACIFGGVYWLGKIAVSEGRHAAWGLAFLLVPATLVAIDSMTVDVALAALTACFAWQVKTGRERGVWVTVAAACLVRETGVLLFLAALLTAVFQRNFRRSAWLATAVIPMLCWYGYLLHVLPHIGLRFRDIVPLWAFPMPRGGVVGRALYPRPYVYLSPAFRTIARWLDRLALGAIMGAVIMGIVRLKRTRPAALKTALALHLLLLLTMTRIRYWSAPYSYVRPLGPMFVLLLVGDGSTVACCGMASVTVSALVDLRILAEWRDPVLHVLHWAAGG